MGRRFKVMKVSAMDFNCVPQIPSIESGFGARAFMEIIKVK
jgi:hypothetical protein